MFQVSTSGTTHQVEQQDKQWLIDGLPANAEVQNLGNGAYHLIMDGQSLLLEVLKADAAARQYTIRVNGKVLDLDLKDKTTLLLEKMGLNTKAKAKQQQLKAPMPGLIVDVMVQPDQTLHKGDIVLVLEAMKMENAIKAEADVVVDQVKVQKGDKVEKGAVLVTYKA